ncbi:lysophospholipid acyltransferase family protein [Larkinella terrae]|uniref:Lipid A biosynthesis acyltransferase n=1 Tax=Larkinella terrae TaxID=2025311 RepID=A0A7K0EMC6_9BACT|nr:lysophospholipid acyltransferase family protein [Larkinella terrae]MRS62987.1 lipid A biosynthesis acyltransferase [Larkinella terrae]
MTLAFFRFFSKLPISFLYAISDVLFFLMAYIIRYRKKVIDLNLKRSFPEKSDTERLLIAKKFYRNFADVLVETFKLPGFSPTELKNRVTFINPEVVQDKLAQGQAVLIMASHQCNWEWAPSASVVNGMPADAVYKKLTNELSERLVYYIRSNFGAKPVPMKQLLREMVTRRNEARLIALVADQIPDQPEFGYWTTFMHQETPFYPGPERLARSFNLPVFYIEMQRIRRGHYSLTFYPIAEPPYANLTDGDILNRYRDRLEQTIQEAPSDWLWSHKRWKHQKEKYAKTQVKF